MLSSATSMTDKLRLPKCTTEWHKKQESGSIPEGDMNCLWLCQEGDLLLELKYAELPALVVTHE